ncbi:PAS domain-containing protein [Oceanobacillus kapialis]|uniref:PAS domain-containing protein n=1 Tax=Oceanobacillus kapialis TaxID=481353 RepID=A0ABW5PYS4_9BACI
MTKNIQSRHYLIERALNYTGVGLIITDPTMKDNPIVFANQGFYNLTGYQESEIIGENCRFLQGEETDEASLQEIRDAIIAEQPVKVQLYNYKKDGTGFWNELSIDPMWVEEDQRTYFVGVQKDVTKDKENERQLEEHLKEIERISTPIVPVRDDASVLPLIGTMGEERLDTIMKSVSSYLEESDQDYLIIDLSGLYEVDNNTVARFLKIHQFISLMGKQLLVAGIRPDMAVQTATIQDKFRNMKTFKSVQTALEYIVRVAGDK